MESKNLYISEIFTLDDIEKTYEKSILKQEFYNVDYANEWVENSEPFKKMANYIKTTFAPKKVLDVGCGIGKLVDELRKLDIDAYGLEFSKEFINISPCKDYIYEGNVFDLNEIFEENSFDVVICMEVLEHIPPTKLNSAIQNLKRITIKNLVLTIPSYGPDRYGYYGLPLNEKCWLKDAKENVPFKNLVVDQNNIPDLGHISLATYKWWSLKFLKNGLIRNPGYELKGYEHHDFLKFRWNAYVLSKLANERIEISADNFYCENLYHVEDWGDKIGNVRWTREKFELAVTVTKETEHLFLKMYSGPKEIVYERSIEIKVYKLHENKELKLFLEECQTRSLVIEPDTWYDIPFDIKGNPFDIFILKCEVSESFIPNYLFNSGDCRKLGIAIRSFGAE
ncbi:MAG: class I SAM-dependent methyltransferase [Methanomethylovorans sp.]|uniref:class I SAM-dependent methyltransferase n=1 Tax=Methanomethylovorans sp. TaxID=2758717 RepID=UPI00345ECD46